MTLLIAMFQREVLVGEPDYRSLPTFAVEAFEQNGSHYVDRADLLADDLGMDAKVWLSSETRNPWRYALRVSRPRHPREVERQRVLLFLSTDDAEQFSWWNRGALLDSRLDDLSQHLSKDMMFVEQEIREGRFDASKLSISLAVRRFEELRQKLRNAASLYRQADDLQRGTGRYRSISYEWVRKAHTPLGPSPRLTDGSSLMNHSEALSAFDKERLAGQYDLSMIPERKCVDRAWEFIWKARKVRTVWRRENQIRRRTGLQPVGQPFQCQS